MKKTTHKNPNRLIGSGIEFLWLIICTVSSFTAFYDIFARNNQSSHIFALFSVISFGMYYIRRYTRIKRENELQKDNK